MTIQGSVDPKTANVPLHLPGGYRVHFEGRRDDGNVFIRVARSTTGPVLDFADIADLQHYIDAALPAIYGPVAREKLADWLELRVAELAPS